MSGAPTRRGLLTSSAAAALGLAVGVAPAPLDATLVPAAAATLNDRRLQTMADRLDALQAHANAHAAGAGWDLDDPYTQAVAEMDLVAAGMAGLPADTMTGVLLKVRAMAVPIVADDDEAHALALSICRDLRRLHAVAAFSPSLGQVTHG